jgi:hypothetical protein
MALDKTTADAALKEDYQPVIREQLDNTNMILAQVEKNDKDVEGRRAVLSLHVGRNSGVGARAEGGDLPTPGQQGYREERVGLRYNYGTIQVSGPVIRAMKSDSGSFTRAVDSEVKGVVRDTKRDVNRQVHGTSNGVIATTGETTTSDTVVLATATTLTQLRQLSVGDKIDIGTVANPVAVAENREIEAVDRSAKTITISGANVSTVNGTHFIFRTGAGGATGGAGQKELTGLQTIVSDSGELFNVNPTTTPVWKSQVRDNGGTLRAPSDGLFEEIVDEIAIESGAEPDLLVTTHGVRRAYAAGLKDQKRFNNTVELKGGFKAVSVTVGSSDLAFAVDRDTPAGRAYLLTTSHLIHFVSSDWEFMDEDGAVLNRVPGKDAYEATLFKYHELATDNRGAHGVVKDLQGD